MEVVTSRLGQDHGCDAVTTRLSADKLLPHWLGNEMQMQGSDLMAITFISCVSINCLIHVGKPHERNIAGYI